MSSFPLSFFLIFDNFYKLFIFNLCFFLRLFHLLFISTRWLLVFIVFDISILKHAYFVHDSAHAGAETDEDGGQLLVGVVRELSHDDSSAHEGAKEDATLVGGHGYQLAV